MFAFRSFRFVAGLVLIAALMLVSVIFLSRVPEHQAKQGQWVGHTREVMAQLNLVALHVAQAELSRTPTAATRITPDIDALQALTADNPRQQVRIHGLRTLVAPLTQPGHAKRANEPAIESAIGVMMDEEQTLLKQRTGAWKRALHHTKAVIVGDVVLLFLAVGFVYTLLGREAEKRRLQAVRGQAEAARMNQIVELQHAVVLQRLDLPATMQVIAESVQHLVGADGGIIEMAEGDEMVYTAASGSGAPHVGLRIKMGSSLSGLCVTESRALRCDDTDTDDRVDRAACVRVGVRSMVVVPLYRRGAVVGVLKVLSSQRHAFVQKDVDTLELLASFLSSTLSDAVAIDDIRTINRTLAEQKDELQLMNAQLESLASTDGLTGLKNHRTFRERLTDDFNRARRYGSPLSLVLIDVDHFKQFNDHFGHPAGDLVLKRVGRVLKEVARTTDCVARHGGEEFAVLLPETALEGAMIIAERLRAAVAGVEWDMRAITVSVGVGSFHAGMAENEALLESADKALYTAKHNGRNRVSRAA